jgi:hypothetical protein
METISIFWIAFVWIICYKFIIIRNECFTSRKNDTANDQMWYPPEKCTHHLRKGKYVEWIDIMEEVVSINKNVYGNDHK